MAKINFKNPYFGSSVFSKVIDVDTTEKLVTSACPCLSETVFTEDWPTTVK